MPITNPDWVPPIEMTFDVKRPIRSEQGLMLAGNPIAIAGGAPGAPIIVAGWHPYNGNIIGGSTGLIYDHAVDGDVTTIETPALAAGFEYWLEWRGLTKTEGANAALTCDFRLSETGDYTITGYELGNLRASNIPRKPTGKIFLEPQISRSIHMVRSTLWDSSVSAGGVILNTGITLADDQPGFKADDFVFTRTDETRIDRLRLVSSVAGGIQGGRAYLFRRRFEGY